MTQATTTNQTPTKVARPKYTNIYVGWCVFLGIYQIFFGVLLGGMYLGNTSPFLQSLSTGDLWIVDAVIGIAAFAVAYGLWYMKWWGLVLGFLLQGMLIAVSLTGLVSRFMLGNPAPVVWDIVNLAFVAFNLMWAFSRSVRDAYLCQPYLTNGVVPSGN